jgi:hypothetical protein
VFTDKRLIFVNRQGLTGRKVEYQSIPYRSIVRFSVETAGSFELGAELKIWLRGSQEPIQLQFNRKLNIYTVQSVLASYGLREMLAVRPSTRGRLQHRRLRTAADWLSSRLRHVGQWKRPNRSRVRDWSLP